ncbi:MAG: twin-arginine translocase subunit TatC [Fibrobacterales bacterium]
MSESVSTMPLMTHLGELKNRVFKIALAVFLSGATCLFNIKYVWQFFLNPYIKSSDINIINIAPTEALIIDFKVAFMAGAIIASPIIFWQVYSFIAPALYKKEKRVLIPAVFFSVLFFLMGAGFALVVVIPASLSFLATYGSSVAEQTWTQASYANFLIRMMMVFAIMFQMPIITSFLAGLKLITAQFLLAQFKIAILVIFVVAAMLTPPDPVSMVLLACPIIVLYLLSVLLAWVFNRQGGANA